MIFFSILFARGGLYSSELNFSIFATGNNMLHNHYRCFGNPRDKIHIGFNGIRELEHLIERQISRVDNRSYSTVTKSNIS